MEPQKSDAPEASSSIIGTPKRWSLLKKFQSEKVPFEREKVRGKRGLLSISSSTRAGESPGLSASPVKVRGMKGSFRLKEGPSAELGKGTMKPRPASFPLMNDGGAVGVINASNAGGAMRKMLEGLHNTRTRLEQNQRSYDRTRRSIEELDKQTSHMRMDYQNVTEKWNEMTENAAVMMTELTCVEISDKVLGETLTKTEEELNNNLEELFKIRMETSQMSSDYLHAAISSGMLWNGTSLGHQNRIKHWEAEFENMDRYKRQLEQELSDFLALLRGIEDSLRIRDEEAKKMEEQEVALIKQEREIQGRVNELDTILHELIREEKEFVQSSEDECEKLKRELEEAQSKMGYLQGKGNEAKTTIKAQKVTITSSGKHFQFKKKASSSCLPSVNEEKENSSTSFDMSDSDFNDTLNNF